MAARAEKLDVALDVPEIEVGAVGKLWVNATHLKGSSR
jgi:hypothetical protein